MSIPFVCEHIKLNGLSKYIYKKNIYKLEINIENAKKKIWKNFKLFGREWTDGEKNTKIGVERKSFGAEIYNLFSFYTHLELNDIIWMKRMASFFIIRIIRYESRNSTNQIPNYDHLINQQNEIYSENMNQIGSTLLSNICPFFLSRLLTFFDLLTIVRYNALCRTRCQYYFEIVVPLNKISTLIHW